MLPFTPKFFENYTVIICKSENNFEMGLITERHFDERESEYADAAQKDTFPFFETGY